ncbi:zinc finger CCCH domain-containing protein 6-like isoform X1 [Vigna unguiculata]|uniref:C3H1-type domain-containing protein n=2 Tax=Vigna unguiculata TaxID=3917 RepID=A0A4D6KW82_VIGUN|nr:zinc finger CCCH domain-containing protein 6-like isoform X1 [Vigna unguiculata]QCD82048.1 hypothetical protein DEO72_LG2g2381 [Vigna unguiculata]
MKRARKSNRVSWATGGNLCQVKLFLSDDSPSKVGQHSQDHLQVKTSMLNSNSTINDPNDLPPGFESSHFLKQTRVDFSCISQIKWECPLPFVVNPDWRVVAGEESREKENQKARENRVLEAVYPRLSAIPPSPSVSLDVEEEDYDDDFTPLIPIIPIEDEESVDIFPEEAVAGNPFPNVQPNNSLQYISAETSIRSPSNAFYTDSSDPCTGIPLGGVSFGMEADLAASVVATIMRSSEQGSPIDMDLLVKIFNDPKMLDKLINEHSAATTTSAYTSTGDSTPGVKPAATPVMLSTSTDVKASGATPTSGVGSLPFGLKTAYPSVSVLSPTPDKPATLPVPAAPSVSPFSPAHDNPVTAPVPLSRPLSGKPGIPSVSLLTTTHASHIPRSVSKQIHHVSSGISPTLNTQPQQDSALASGPKRAAAMAGELSTGPVPSLTRNLHAVVNPVQSPASTLPYKLSTGSSAFAVKDANYYKNLIRQHGADKQDMQDSHIGIRHSNLQDLKPVHNFKQGEVKHKIQKPCIYFKSSKGCRNGSNCPYQHDVSAQWGAGNILGAQSAKRLKLGP